jgi:hypothetical protein
MNKDQATTLLLGINLVTGIIFMLFPRTAMRLYQVDPDASGVAAFPTRVLGCRSLLFAALLADEKGRAVLLPRLPMLAALDLGVSGIALVTEELPRKPVLQGAATAVVTGGLALIARDR